MGLEEVLKDLEKVSGQGAIMRGVEIKPIERIPLRAYALNRMLYGGIPKGRIVEFAGAESSGKTTTALLVAASYQAQDERPVFFIDSEGTYDSRWAAKLGVDNSPEHFIKWAPENATAEEVFQGILNVASTNEVGLIILDSIPVLVPQQEEAKTMDQMTMGGIAAALTKFARKLQKVLLKNPTLTFIGINQIRDNMSQYGPTTTTVGGHAWKHACSIRMEFKSSNVDANGSDIAESVENPAGVKISAVVKKNKAANRDRKLGFYLVNFTTGFNELDDLVTTAVVTQAVKHSGAGYSYFDKETGELLVSALGKAKFIEKLTPEIIAKITKEVKESD